jgi:hypothetical protein
MSLQVLFISETALERKQFLVRRHLLAGRGTTPTGLGALLHEEVVRR